MQNYGLQDSLVSSAISSVFLIKKKRVAYFVFPKVSGHISCLTEWTLKLVRHKHRCMTSLRTERSLLERPRGRAESISTRQEATQARHCLMKWQACNVSTPSVETWDRSLSPCAACVRRVVPLVVHRCILRRGAQQHLFHFQKLRRSHTSKVHLSLEESSDLKIFKQKKHYFNY